MLINILKEIGRDNTHSYTTLAKTLKLEQEMVKQMFSDLQRMGYIAMEAPECSTDKCAECLAWCTNKKSKKVKQESGFGITRWKLTEKGKEMIGVDNLKGGL